MKKKGMGSDLFKTLMVVMLVLIMFGVYLYFTSHTASGGRSLIDFLRGSKPDRDFDGDGIPDSIDPCPCGSPPNMQNHQDSFEGIQRCVQKLEPCSEEYTEYGFQTQTDSRGREVCTYRKADCMKLIEDKTN